VGQHAGSRSRGDVPRHRRGIAGRRVGEASDIAQTYLYLMREGFSTGQVIVVDGGTVLV